MRISASIYARNAPGDAAGLESTVRELDAHGVDYLHVDCADDPAVFEDIRRIRGISRTPIDLHLITPDPAPYFRPIRELGVELVSVQAETLRAPWAVPEDLAGRTGWAFTARTPLEAFGRQPGRPAFALLMATTPGRSGGRFDAANFRRIRAFRRRYPGVPLHVDGGVDQEVGFILRNQGVRTAVSGSFLMGRLGPRMVALQRAVPSGGEGPSAEGHSGRFRVADFMWQPDELPLLPWPDDDAGRPDFAALLRAIEDGAMGFALLRRPNGRLAGLVSNADVRRGLLARLDDLNRVRPDALINPTPFCARADWRVPELLEAVQACPFPVGYCPVLDDRDRLAGALLFHHLIKGEA